MKRITQTKQIPISSLKIVFINYLKFFKSYFVFGVIPSIICFASMIFVLRNKVLALSQQMISLQPVFLSQNKDLILSSLKGVLATILSIITSPSFILAVLINIAITVIAFSCLLIGIKHTFYKKQDLGAILKEGLNNTFRFLWTMLTYAAIYILAVCVGTLLNFTLLSSLSDFEMLYKILTYLVITICISTTVFYPCIHLFSANDPFSAIYFSFSTLFKNFLPWLIVFIVSFAVKLVIGISFVVVFFSFIFMGKAMNFSALIIAGVIALLVLPYLTNMSQIMISIMTFIAYPELFDNDSPVQEDLFVQQPYSTADSLSFANTPKSDTPFINQRSEQNGFDR